MPGWMKPWSIDKSCNQTSDQTWVGSRDKNRQMNKNMNSG